jgi:hypothetical protein
MPERYIVTEPVENGYAWFTVADQHSGIMPNFAVATFFRYMPQAREEAHALCARLNASQSKK